MINLKTNEKIEEKNYYKYVTKDGMVVGNQYLELQKIYKEVVEENIDLLLSDFNNENLDIEKLNEYEKMIYFKEEREKLKEKLRAHLIFINMGNFLKNNKMGILMEYKDTSIIDIKEDVYVSRF